MQCNAQLQSLQQQLNTCNSQLNNVQQQLTTCNQQLPACNSQTTPSPQIDTVCPGQLATCNTQLTSFTSQKPEMNRCVAINGIVACVRDPGCDFSCLAGPVLELYNWYTDINIWCIKVSFIQSNNLVFCIFIWVVGLNCRINTIYKKRLYISKLIQKFFFSLTIDFSLIYWKSINMFSCPGYLEHLAQPTDTPVLALHFCYPYFHLTLTNVCHALMDRLVYCNVLQILLNNLQVSMLYVGVIVGVPSVHHTTVKF